MNEVQAAALAVIKRCIASKKVRAADREDYEQQAYLEWSAKGGDPWDHARRVIDTSGKKLRRQAAYAKQPGITVATSSDYSQGVSRSERRTTNPVELKQRTLQDCERRYRESTGRRWSPRSRSVIAARRLLEEAQQAREIDARALKALKKFHEGYAELAEVARLTESLGHDVEPTGSSATQFARRIAALRLPRDVQELLKKRARSVRSYGLGSLNQERQWVAYLAKQWATGPVTATELAVVWLLLGNWPSKLRMKSGGLLPSEVVDSVAKGFEGALEKAEEAEDPAELEMTREIEAAIADLQSRAGAKKS